MSDKRFDDYINYHRAFAKMFGAKEALDYDAIEFEDDGETPKKYISEKGKDINGGY